MVEEPEGGQRDDGPAPGGRASPPWRNPWIVSFVLGAITLTLLRPCMRYVPEPPEVMTVLPALVGTLTAEGRAGRAWESASLGGAVHVLHGFCAGCEGEREAHLAALGRMRDRYREAGIAIMLWSVGLDGPTAEEAEALCAAWGCDPDGWQIVALDEASRARFLATWTEQRARVAVLEGWISDGDSSGWVILDPEGGLRGFYPWGRPEVEDEVLHRSRRVQLAYGQR